VKKWRSGIVVLAAVLAASCLASLFLLAAQEEQVGRFQVTAPDLVTDTTTGRIVDGSGKVIEAGVSTSARELGRYQAAGYVKVVPKEAIWDALGRPVMQSTVEKGFVIIDTATGQVLRKRVYSSKATTVETMETPAPDDK